MLSLISFSHATKFSWPMAKLLKSRPNVLEEPFTNIAFQYFLPVPDRSIHELLVLCLSPKLQGPNSKIGKQCSLNSTSSDFFHFLFTALVFGRASSQWRRCIGETGNCGRQNCNLRNALSTGWPLGTSWAHYSTGHITVLDTGHWAQHSTGRYKAKR